MRRCNGPVSPMRHWINLLHTLSSSRDKIAIAGGSLYIFPPMYYLSLSLPVACLSNITLFLSSSINSNRVWAYCFLSVHPHSLLPASSNTILWWDCVKAQWYQRCCVKVIPREKTPAWALWLVAVCERCFISDTVSLINFSAFRQSRGPSRQIEAAGYIGKLDGDVFWYLGEKKKWLRWSKGAGLLSENTDLMHDFS